MPQPSPPRTQQLAGARALVMGLGSFGGGAGAARFLAYSGADVLVTDLRPPDELTDSLAELADLLDHDQITLRLGEHNISDFTAADLIVVSPAVPAPWGNRFLRAAQAASVPITTEMRLLFERLPNPQHVVGVTGTAGKSTTAAMIAHAIEHIAPALDPSPRVHLGGNIGGSLLPTVNAIRENDWVILELSSFMLYWLGKGVGAAHQPGLSPAIALLTNLAPNHLDWHPDFDHYIQSKANIFRSQPPSSSAIIPAATWEQHRADLEPAMTAGAQLCTDIRADDLPPLKLPGAHNRLNAALAAAAIIAAISPSTAIQEKLNSALAHFPGLPHRMQLISERTITPAAPPARIYNDSKSTTPEATALAIAALLEDAASPAIHLICGGYDKGLSLAPLVKAAARCKAVYTIGATGPAIAAALKQTPDNHVNIVEAGSLESAIEQAIKQLQPGDSLLLSPGCASWDQFRDYRQRGDAFIRTIKKTQ